MSEGITYNVQWHAKKKVSNNNKQYITEFSIPSPKMVGRCVTCKYRMQWFANQLTVVLQSWEPHPTLDCERLRLSRMPVSYPIMTISPVTNETMKKKHIHSVLYVYVYVFESCPTFLNQGSNTNVIYLLFFWHCKMKSWSTHNSWPET